MPTCMQWARGREEFGADPRGELQKKEQWNNPNDMRAQRGAQTDFGAELPQKAIGADVKKQPDLSTSVSMGACPNFQHVRKIHGFAFGSDQKQLHKTCSRCLIIPFFPIKRAHQGYRRRQNTRGDDFVNTQVPLCKLFSEVCVQEK